MFDSEIRDDEFAETATTYLASVPMELILCKIASSRRGEQVTCHCSRSKCSSCRVAREWRARE